jgi:hypothetical protein
MGSLNNMNINLNIYQAHGAENLGWFSKEQIYGFANNLHAAVYSFAFLEKCPEQNVFPHELENTFYVGQTGNKQGDHLFYDQKNRRDMGTYMAPRYGIVTSVVKMRMKAHFKEFQKEYSGQADTYSLFHESFTPSLRPNYQPFVNILIPPSNLPDVAVKSWLLMVENTVIHSYIMNWNKEVLCNLANKTLKRTVKGSISEQNLNSYKSGNLLRFCNE